MEIADRKWPADPLHFIRECVRHRRVLWTYQVNMRLQGRFIPREAVLDAVETYEIIEAYPGDKSFPAIWCWQNWLARSFTFCLP